MKPLLINTFTSGGAAKACIRLHNALHDINIDSALFTRDGSSEDIQNHLTYGQDFGIIKKYIQTIYHKAYRAYSINSKPNYLRKLESFNDPKSSYSLEKEQIVQEADIINLHWVNNFIDYSSFFSKIDKPIVWTLHDMQPFSGGYAYEYNFPFSKAVKRVKKNVDVKTEALRNKNVHIVALNNWMKNKAVLSETFKSFDHTIIPNSINTEVFKPVDKYKARSILNLSHESKIILFVAFSAKVKRKGFHILSSALKSFEKEDIEVITIGQTTFSNSNHITELGVIRDERKLALVYSAADVFILPSLADNSPNTVLESQCCGTPVVGFKIGGVPELIDHCSNGLLVNRTDVRSFVEGTMNALEYNWSCQDISTKARLKYSRKTQAQAYKMLFQSIL